MPRSCKSAVNEDACMKEVYLDGEHVDFQGAPPSSVAAAWELVGNYLAGQERVVDSTEVDGSTWDPDADENREQWGRIELRSVSLEEKLVGLALDWKSRRAEMRSRIEALSGGVLRKGWREAQGEVFAVFEALRPLVEQYGALASFGEAKKKDWADPLVSRYGAFSQALGSTSNAVEEEDCVALSDLLEDELAPSMVALISETAASLEREKKGRSE